MPPELKFVSKQGVVVVRLEAGQKVALPIFPGFLKHPQERDLARLLRKYHVARK